MVKNIQIAEMDLDGGTLCLDFINTVHDRMDKPMKDYLNATEDLIDWGVLVGVLGHEESTALRETHVGSDDSFFKKSIAIREMLYGIFYNIAHKKPLPSLDQFNALFNGLAQHLKIAVENDLIEERWHFETSNLEQIIAPLLKDAKDLLLSDKLDRVKECPNCGWIFLDSTKNGKRKWCSMKNCGNNVKALEWYHRQKNFKTE